MQSRYENAFAQRESHPEEALMEFRLMAEETPDINGKAALLLNEVGCYEILGRLDDANRVLEEIGKLAPVDDIRLNVSIVAARVCSQREEHKKAALQYRNILQEYAQLLSTEEHRADYEDICLRRAMELALCGEHREAVPILKQAGSFSTLTDENRQRVHLWLGFCYAELCKNNLAIDEFQRVIAFNRVNAAEADARYHLADSFYMSGEFVEAKLQIEAILHLEAAFHPTLTDKYRQLVHLLLGYCHIEMHESDLAIHEFQRVIAFKQINDLEAETLYRLAHAYFLRRGFAQAKLQLETILQDYKEVCKSIPLNYVYILLSRACNYLGEKENANHYSIMARTSKNG